MGKHIALLVLALLVIAAMGVTVLWFFRRLKLIEDNRKSPPS